VTDFGPSHHPSVHTHRRWGSIEGSGVATDRGSRGGSRIPITRGSIRGLRNKGRGPPLWG
jgi:hypothetical protein